MLILYVYLIFYFFLSLGVLTLRAEITTPIFKGKKFKVSMLITWYDLWLGIYIKPNNGTVYIGIPFWYIVIEPLGRKPISRYTLNKMVEKFENQN